MSAIFIINITGCHISINLQSLEFVYLGAARGKQLHTGLKFWIAIPRKIPLCGISKESTSLMTACHDSVSFCPAGPGVPSQHSAPSRQEASENSMSRTGVPLLCLAKWDTSWHLLPQVFFSRRGWMQGWACEWGIILSEAHILQCVPLGGTADVSGVAACKHTWPRYTNPHLCFEMSDLWV